MAYYKQDKDTKYNDKRSKVENFLGNKIKFPRFDTSEGNSRNSNIFNF